ncbi:MAG: hypothetical protein ACOZNI_06680 [Myxococcota bacterium]
MWIVEETPAYREGPTKACAPVESDEVRLPVGLRGEAKPARAECAEGWMFVRFETGGVPTIHSQAWYVPKEALATKPPKPTADKAKATGPAFVKQAGERPIVGIPLDDPSWTSPAFLFEGEPVELLGPGWVRTSTGREVWLDTFHVEATDPLLGTTSQSDTESAPLRRRLAAGRLLHERGAPLAPLPPAAELAKGRAYLFTVRPEWLSEPRFSPEWFDPVGHLLDHACGEKTRPFEPCGRFPLDYAPLGAWWPERETLAIGVWDGKALAVVVLDPFGDRVMVTPTWDGATPAP